MGQLLKNLLCALATGYILFVFSERIFWTVWRPNDSLPDLIITWLAYSATAYLFLATVSWSRADDFWTYFLAGAVYGWLVEGGLIYTLYGTEPSAPFPLSISITGLSWHALVSVVLGWWATGRALTARRPMGLVWVTLGIGVFWGVWAMFPRRETPPILTTAAAFFLNALLLSVGLMAGWWISFRTGLRHFRPGKTGLALCTILVGLFYIQHVRSLGILPLIVFPLVLSLALIPLDRHRRSSGRSSTPELFSGHFHLARLPMIGLIPIVATLVYVVAAALGMDRLPISTIVYYVVGGPSGFVLLVLAIFVTTRRTARGAQEASSDG